MSKLQKNTFAKKRNALANFSKKRNAVAHFCGGAKCSDALLQRSETWWRTFAVARNAVAFALYGNAFYKIAPLKKVAFQKGGDALVHIIELFLE